MPRRPTYPPLDVYINSRRVGQLRRSSSGAVEFQYAPEWLVWKHAFPVSLSLPMREDAYSGRAVIAVFDNLLPDSDAVRQRVAARTQADGTDAYSLLSTVGRDCVGAMQFLEEGVDPGEAGAIQSRPVSDAETGQLLRDLAKAPLGIAPEDDFRISIAGVQDKTALLRLNDGWHLPERSTATTHILKPQIGRAGDFDMSDSVENEYLCLKLLAALGFDVAATEITDFDGTRALVIERFDREWTSDGRLLRRPQEDLCQVLSVPSNRKYQSDGGPGITDVLELLKASDDPDTDQYQFLKAQMAFWLLGAIDGHAKNFSIFLYPGGGFRLTPLYDVMTVQHKLEQGRIRRNQAKMAMSVGSNRHYRLYDIQPRHYAQTLESAGLSPTLAAQAMSDLLDAAPAAIEQCCGEPDSLIPSALIEGVAAGLNRRAAAASSWLNSL